mmetsp:Transcript_30009/g.63593  ORF Transcript_30009/g.63593 Transcript_30009/m.63593 type:complete len:230 (+) Transcript_30009:667-1356(+)
MSRENNCNVRYPGISMLNPSSRSAIALTTTGSKLTVAATCSGSAPGSSNNFPMISQTSCGTFSGVRLSLARQSREAVRSPHLTCTIVSSAACSGTRAAGMLKTSTATLPECVAHDPVGANAARAVRAALAAPIRAPIIWLPMEDTVSRAFCNCATTEAAAVLKPPSKVSAALAAACAAPCKMPPLVVSTAWERIIGLGECSPLPNAAHSVAVSGVSLSTWPLTCIIAGW